MSVDYTSYAVIGCEIPVKALTTRNIKRACKHSIQSDHKFCPECGKPAWETGMGIPDWYQPDSDRIYDKDKNDYVNLVFSTDQKHCIAGFWSRADNDNPKGFLTPSHLGSETREKVRAILESVGLWDESKFGLYAVQYCSY